MYNTVHRMHHYIDYRIVHTIRYQIEIYVQHCIYNTLLYRLHNGVHKVVILSILYCK